VDGMARPFGFNAGMIGGQAISTTKKVVQPHVVSVREQARLAAENGQTNDEYATLRELYYEQRAAEIADAPGSDRYTSPNTSAPPLQTSGGLQQARASVPPPPPTRAQQQQQGWLTRASAPTPQGYGRPDAGYERYGDTESEARQAQADAAFDAGNPPPLPPPERSSGRGYRPAHR
ncbi:MAG: hypothetical protein JO157_03345, partial [Acetobacteraceae bacterium]|nr:hypothetical protein [Acetobacteraceae bacterium]